MKRVIAAALVLAFFTGPVFAQPSNEDDPIILQDKNRKKDAEDVDKQYKRTLDKTRKASEATARTDPWSNMRAPADDPKSTKR
jgi:hypothetical protein